MITVKLKRDLAAVTYIFFLQTCNYPALTKFLFNRTKKEKNAKREQVIVFLQPKFILFLISS